MEGTARERERAGEGEGIEREKIPGDFLVFTGSL